MVHGAGPQAEVTAARPRRRYRRGYGPAAATALFAAVIALALLAGVEESTGDDSVCTPAPAAHCAEQDLTFANLLRADLRGADLRAASLHGSLLHGAVLAGADLRAADLRASTLNGADLTGVSLAGANLADANLAHAKVTPGQLAAAHLCDTRLPRGGVSVRDCADAAPPLQRPATTRISEQAARDAAAPSAGTGAKPISPRTGTALRQLAPGDGAGAQRTIGAPRDAGAKLGKQGRTRAKKRGKRKRAVVVKVRGGAGTVIAGPARRARKVVAARGRIECPGSCRARYPVRARLTLKAIPQEGYRLVSLTGRQCRGMGKRCTIRVSPKAKRNRAIAIFEPVPSKPADPLGPPDPADPLVPPPPACNVPLDEDTDEDGLPDCMELAGWKLTVHQPQSLIDGAGPETRNVSSDPLERDTDGDGVDDGVEFRFNSDPWLADGDRDGLTDRDEITVHGTLPNHADSDGDSLPPRGSARDPRLFDGNEISELRSSPRLADTDGDGLSDFVELRERTNPRVADLPVVELISVPGRSNPRFDIPTTVEETTGTESETETAVGITSSSTSASEWSRQTTHTASQSSSIGGSCQVMTQMSGCSVSASHSWSSSDSVANGTQSSISNGRELSSTHQKIARQSASRQTTIGPGGCMQVVLRLRNGGPVSVSVGNLQVLAWVPSPAEPDSSALLADLQPIDGQEISSECPATAPGFGPVELPPGGSADIAFSRQVEAGTILDYWAEPTPISYELGAISMTGTNLAGEKVDFQGEVATKVRDRSAQVNVDFGDGTLRSFAIAADAAFAPDGESQGVTLLEALGPGLADLAPQFGGSPAKLTSLREPESEKVVANAADARDGVWNVYGDAAGIGDQQVDWREVVLRPGDVVNFQYGRDSDRDGLLDTYETMIGTAPDRPDTDDDGAGCIVITTECPVGTPSDYFEARIGWTVPFARGSQSEYKAFPSPLSCDVDGDESPDGPGAGNLEHGECPESGFASESERLTDPTRADSNEDGLLDGTQPLPDVLRAVPQGGRVPVPIRHWGGSGELGAYEPIGIAVDGNQPIWDEKGRPAPVDSYVARRSPLGTGDDIVKFSGNPRTGPPIRKIGSMTPTPVDFTNNTSLIPAVTGIAVGPGTVGSGDDAGSPVIANFYAASAASISDPTQGTAALTTFNGTTGEDMGRNLGIGDGGVFGSYGADCCFKAPILDPASDRPGNGFIDVAGPHSVVVGHGRDNAAPLINATDQQALPSRYFGINSEADLTMRYGRKPTIGRDGEIETEFPEESRLVNPSGIAIDRENGTLFVADKIETGAGPQPGAITRFDLASGEIEAFLKEEDGTLAGLQGLAVSPDGEYLYAAAQHCKVVYKLSRSLSVLAAIGGEPCTETAADSSFERPIDVDVDAEDGVWIADAGSKLLSFYFYPFGP